MTARVIGNKIMFKDKQIVGSESLKSKKKIYDSNLSNNNYNLNASFENEANFTPKVDSQKFNVKNRIPRSPNHGMKKCGVSIPTSQEKSPKQSGRINAKEHIFENPLSTKEFVPQELFEETINKIEKIKQEYNKKKEQTNISLHYYKKVLENQNDIDDEANIEIPCLNISSLNKENNNIDEGEISTRRFHSVGEETEKKDFYIKDIKAHVSSDSHFNNTIGNNPYLNNLNNIQGTNNNNLMSIYGTYNSTNYNSNPYSTNNDGQNIMYNNSIQNFNNSLNTNNSNNGNNFHSVGGQTSQTHQVNLQNNIVNPYNQTQFYQANSNLNSSQQFQQFQMQQANKQEYYNSYKISSIPNVKDKSQKDLKLDFVLSVMDLSHLIFYFEIKAINFKDLLLLDKNDLIELELDLVARNRIKNFSESYNKHCKLHTIEEIVKFFFRFKAFIYNVPIFNEFMLKLEEKKEEEIHNHGHGDINNMSSVNHGNMSVINTDNTFENNFNININPEGDKKDDSMSTDKISDKRINLNEQFKLKDPKIPKKNQNSVKNSLSSNTPKVIVKENNIKSIDSDCSNKISRSEVNNYMENQKILSVQNSSNIINYNSDYREELNIEGYLRDYEAFKSKENKLNTKIEKLLSEKKSFEVEINTDNNSKNKYYYASNSDINSNSSLDHHSIKEVKSKFKLDNKNPKISLNKINSSNDYSVKTGNSKKNN